MIYHRPKTIEEAVSILRRASGTTSLLAGGTDLMPRWSTGLAEAPHAILDLKHIPSLRGASRDNGEIRLGACSTMSEIESDPLICSSAPVLAEAAGRVACPQVRNRATIGGNLCNASPAADAAVPLILVDAMLDLASAGGCGGQDGNSVEVRQVPIADFFRGPGSTALAPGEILTHIRFKPLPESAFASWDKFGTRPSMEIAVASVGVMVNVRNGKVADSRVAYGSVAPVPLRGRGAEAALKGNPLNAEVIGRCEAAARAEIAPITDVRASESYRRDLVTVMLRRMLEDAQRSRRS